MAQSVLNFSVASTDERLTPRSGEIVFGEYLKAIGLDKLCNAHLPQPQSNRGYAPFTFIQPLLLMDIRMIASDMVMKDILNMKSVPTADTSRKWIKRHGLLGVYEM